MQHTKTGTVEAGVAFGGCVTHKPKCSLPRYGISFCSQEQLSIDMCCDMLMGGTHSAERGGRLERRYVVGSQQCVLHGR